MQRRLLFLHRSEEEEIKEAGLTLDFDEMAKKQFMSKEENLIAKWYGIYGSRQPGDHMMRVVIPGGVLSTDQARALAAISLRHGKSVLSITTRQAVQFHFLKLVELPAVLREVREAGLSSFHGCGDVTRTMTACPLAETCPYRRFDVRPYAREAMQALTDARDLDNLPRKFKITWSGCGAGCAQPGMNCVGMVAVTRKIKGVVSQGFTVYIGGGMGWKAFVAQPLFTFIPADKAVAVSRAIALLYRDHGDRYNRQKSRLKFVVDRLGIEECRRIVKANLVKERVSTKGMSHLPIKEVGPAFPERPLVDSLYQKNDPGAVRILIPKGELSDTHLFAIAQLSDRYADRKLYTTNRQNLELHGVEMHLVDELKAKIRELGFATEGGNGLPDIVACVGTTYCPKAVSTTRLLFNKLEPLVNSPLYAGIRELAIINITGCPNSCSPYRIADIGFRGLRIREDAGSVEGYLMTIGGTQWKHGHEIGQFKVDDCEQAVRRVLDLFKNLREGTETLADCVSRVGVEPFKTSVAGLMDYRMAPPLSEYHPAKGVVRSAAAKKAIARDIPCQEACPARTNVPAYIEEIMHGRHDDSHAINLECNVFPGVLGRVCTRPCEDRCRHQWTNINGPVTICHLKRAASDRAAQSTPPAPWRTGKTGKKVAVIGAGPAGLTAARELVRLGHEVTVFERESHPGGMMIDGIPRFRLPQTIVEQEIATIAQTGVDIKVNESVNAARIEELAKSHDAVCVATGTMTPCPLPIEGMPEGGAIYGLNFMADYNNGRISELEGDIVVIGGGFTAVDCARSSARAARRLLGDKGHITIVYRRGERQMSANEDERAELHRENIDVRTLAVAVRAETENGVLRGIVFRRTILDYGDGSGKPAFSEVPGSEFTIPCSLCIIAIGQVREEILPQGVFPSGEGYTTNNSRIFVTGDYLTGAGNVIQAVAHGKGVAYHIDETLMGERFMETVVDVTMTEVDGDTGRVRDHDARSPSHMATEPVVTRADDHLIEIEKGFTDKQALENATRCYFCHYSFEIDQDLCIHCNWCIDVSPRRCIKRISRVTTDQDGFVTQAVETGTERDATYIRIDGDECIRCGKCLRVCPTGAITMKRVALETRFCEGGCGS